MYRTRKQTKRYNPKQKRQVHLSGQAPCPFCDMNPDQIVRDGKTMRLIKNIYGYKLWEGMNVNDHLMIVPKRHAEGIAEFNKAEKIEMMDLMAEYEGKGYNVYARESQNAIKSVPHQHTHLLKTHNKRARFFVFSEKPYFVWKI